MDYDKIYENLVNRGKNRIIDDPEQYIEHHHIIPLCMGGDNSESNYTKLTAREHYIAHWLLVKIYKDSIFISKLVCAFRYMSVDSHNGHRRNNRDYEWMRRMYSKYHPMKDPNISRKTSESLKLYNSKLSDEQKIIRSERIKSAYKNMTDEHKAQLSESKSIRMKNRTEEEIKTWKDTLKQSMEDFYNNETEEHKLWRKDIYDRCVNTPEVNIKRSQTHKKRLQNMTEEELLEHIKRSLHTCNHKKRGESISKGKKGKKTNQQEIMGKRYAKMTQEEFDLFILSKSEMHRTRIKNLREKYINDI